MNCKFPIFWLLLLIWSIAGADEYRDKVNEGYDYYKNGQYDKAAEYYRQAGVLKPDKAMPKIGKGSSLYKSNDFEGAGKEFSSAIEKGDRKTAADMRYNVGNALYKAQDYAGAAGSYIEALKINPDDKDYKHNLEMALYRQQQQQQQNQDQKQNKEQKDRKDQDQQKKGDQDQEKQQSDKQEQDQKEKNDQQSTERQDKSPNEKQEKQEVAGDQQMSKEEAENILARFEQDEKEIQKQLKQVNIRGGSGRDW